MGAARQIRSDPLHEPLAAPSALPTEPVLTISPDGVGFTSDAEDGLGYPGGRPHRVRARTVSIKRLAKRDLERGAREYSRDESDTYARPHAREDCLAGEHAERPCPFVSCKHHLYLDVNVKTGSIKLNFPDLEVWELPETCALDVADDGGKTLDDVGALTNLTRERIRQLETKGLEKLRKLAEMASLQDYWE